MASSRSKLIRRIVYILVGLVVLGFIIIRFLQPKSGPQYTTVKAETGDVNQTVALTGTTEPQTRYSLQFSKGGKLSKVLVEMGKVVKAGDVLAVLENEDVQFQVSSQKSALRFAQGNLAKALAKQRPEEARISQLKVDLAQLDADNSGLTKQNLLHIAETNMNNADIALQTAATSLQQAQDQYNYVVQVSQNSAWQQSNQTSTTTSIISGQMTNGAGGYLTDQNNILTAQYNIQKAGQAFEQAQQNYYKAVADFQRQNDDTDNIINKAELGLQTAREQFKLTTATPRDVDVEPLKAQIAQAWAGVHLAEYQLDQTQLKAPTDGLVTDIAFDAGENVSVAQPLITLDSSKLHIKALVSEADITKIQVGQKVAMTFDAFGTVKNFQGAIAEVDPAETIVQGVVYYEVKILFDAKQEQVKPGMTANLTIRTNSHSNVLKVPARSVQYENNQAYIQVLKTIDKKNEVEKRNVEVGLQGDEEVEILSGLRADEEVVTFTKV